MILDLFQTEPRWQARFCWGRSLAPKTRWWVLDSPGNRCPSKVCRARFSYMISMFIKVFSKKTFQDPDLMFFQNCAEFFIGEIDSLIFWLFNYIILSLNMFQNMRSIINQQFDFYSGTYSDIIEISGDPKTPATSICFFSPADSRTRPGADGPRWSCARGLPAHAGLEPIFGIFHVGFSLGAEAWHVHDHPAEEMCSWGKSSNWGIPTKSFGTCSHHQLQTLYCSKDSVIAVMGALWITRNRNPCLVHLWPLRVISGHISPITKVY
jgi:hypothetical protein